MLVVGDPRFLLVVEDEDLNFPLVKGGLESDGGEIGT